jgi:hypothetical protein
VTQKPRSRAHALFSRYVRFAERRTGLVLVCFAVLATVAGFIVKTRFELRTDFTELLPPDHPAVVALRTIPPRQKSATNLVMLIHSPSQEANRKLAETLRPELEKMIPHTFSEIQWKPDTEVPDYGAKWKWLYADMADLERAEDLLDRVIAKRGNPLAAPISDEDPDEELKKLRERLNQKLPQTPGPPGKPASNYFEHQDPPAEGGQHWLGIMMWRKRDGLATRGDHDTLNAVRDIVARVNPTSIHPQLKVDYTGHIAAAIEQQNGVRDDLQLATLTVLFIVLFVIWLYFRRAALILVIGIPTVLGVTVSIAIALLTIKYLNVNTAFLISIILGNGINSPIILLARYGEERHAGRRVGEALATSMAETLLGTLTAMTAASIAYGCLLLTSYRGFSQFGLLGGIGMLLVWILTFLLVPPLVILGERLRPGALTPRANLFRKPFALLGRLSERAPSLLLLCTVVGLVGATPFVVQMVKDPIEWNIRKLDTDATPSNNLWARMDVLGMGDVGAGYIGNNAVFLVDSPDQADAVAEAVRKADAARGPEHCLKAVRTLNDALPTKQEEKLELLARVRRKIDRHVDKMSDDEKREVQAWRPPDYLRTLTVDDLPRIVREAFTEIDGQRGRLIGVDADYTTYSDWEGHSLMRMSKALTVDALGKRWTAASAATVFAGMLETLIADGPRITYVAIAGVVLLVLFAFGLVGAIPVLLSLAIGVFWWGGAMGWLKLKINFMNFVALPITLGVGADYAANIWARLRKDGLAKLHDVIADTGSAVALCSLTTIIGYSSLLMSHNKALRTFGLAADLGEVTTLLAALVALPALLRLVRRRQLTPVADAANAAAAEEEVVRTDDEALDELAEDADDDDDDERPRRRASGDRE